MTDEEKAPESGPSQDSVATQTGWQKLTARSLPTVRESAGKWRDGLAAMITLMTAGLVVSGPDKAGDLESSWRWAVAVALVGGMLLVLIGLLLTVTVAAGTPKAISRTEFDKLGGDPVAVDASIAVVGGKRLQHARCFAVPGIVIVLLAIGAWLVSPAQPASSLQVTTATTIYCGDLSSGDGGVLTLNLGGESQPTTVTYAAVENVAVVETCQAARTPR